MNPATSILLCDLYQLTMLQGYHDSDMADTAVFEFFVRKLRPGRGFLMAAGLEQSLQFLEQLHFAAEELEWLASTGRFSPAFLASLETLRFTGDVHAILEGTVFFPNEPILRVTAPIAQAQLVETRLINLLNLQTLIASKAARSVLVAPDKLLVDTLACAARTGRRRVCWRRARAIWPGFPAPRRYWPASSSAFRCLAPWRIPLSRRMTTRRWRLNILPTPSLTTWCY